MSAAEVNRTACTGKARAIRKSGWTDSWSLGGVRLRLRRNDRADSGEFEIKGTLAAHPMMVVASIWHSIHSGLAGTLTHWEAQARGPQVRDIRYVTALPWPLMDRRFYVRQRFELQRVPGQPLPDLLVHSEDVPPGHSTATPTLPQTCAGRVAVSAYRVRPVLTSKGIHTLLQRRIQIDLDMPWLPQTLGEALLAARYIHDHHRLQTVGQPNSNSPLAHCIQTAAPIYAALRSVWPTAVVNWLAS